MMAKNINRKELATKAEAKYFYITMERPSKEFSGETVEEFLARGGKINRVEKKSGKLTPERDSTGKFLKKNAPIV